MEKKRERMRHRESKKRNDEAYSEGSESLAYIPCSQPTHPRWWCYAMATPAWCVCVCVCARSQKMYKILNMSAVVNSERKKCKLRLMLNWILGKIQGIVKKNHVPFVLAFERVASLRSLMSRFWPFGGSHQGLLLLPFHPVENRH